MARSAADGDRATIVDVARRAGVAISSVSSALNNRPGVSEATRARIVQVADELGFTPSLRGRSLSAQRAFAVGLAVQRDPAVLESDPFFGAFIGGVESVLSSTGTGLVLQLGNDRDQIIERYRGLAADRRVDGIFLTDIEIDDPRIPLLQELGLPVVAVNPDDGIPFASVRQHGARAVADLVGRLVGLGHRRIAHVAGPALAVHARRREEAWRTAMRAHDLAPGPVLAGDFTFESGRRLAGELAKLTPRPTAVFCANDLMAIGLLSAMQDLGVSVPGEISIAGYDGIVLGEYVRPRLTSLRTSPVELGAAAANLLLDRLEDAAETPPVDVEIAPVHLVERDSIGAAA